MPIGDRDYIRGSHPPACTCKDCTDRRLRKWEESSGRPDRTAVPPRLTRRNKTDGALLGCVLKLVVVFILLLFGLVVWSLWGNQISSFITGLSASPPPADITPAPQSPPPEIVRPTPTTPIIEPSPAPVQLSPEPVKPTPAPIPSTPANPPQTVDTKVSYTDEEVEELIYLLINGVRQDYGLNPLIKDTLLKGLASEHSSSMVKHGFFSHDRADDERNFGYGQPPGSLRGENIFKVPQRKIVPGPYLTLEELCIWVVSGWMESIGHRENILESTFTKTGVGVSRLGEYLYITQMFEGIY